MIYNNINNTTKKKSSFEQIKDFDMRAVKITDPYYINAFNKNLEYLQKLKPDRLLAGFRDVSALPKKAKRYGGWESTLIQGHTMGHYLTAIAQAYINTYDKVELNRSLKNRIDYIVNELEICQKANGNGYLFATKESHFDIIEGKNTGATWVPWYTMHKILAGLVNVYKYVDNKKSLKIASDLGDWIYVRASNWGKDIQQRVLNVEYGGINDALYELYKYSNIDKHLIAAHKFDEDSLFAQLADGNDILKNKHANTTIPKFIGALNRYRTIGAKEEFYFNAAKEFWNIVVENHSYVTGGNSHDEHFRNAKKLDFYRSGVNNETCNSYNMLKLSRGLFKLTGDVKYANFYEKSFINEIMSSQNPETGMTTYFKPMESGHFKVYGSATEHFWCCTGSGMENFTKLNDSIYFHTSNDLYVNLYLSSILRWKEKGMILSQEADLPKSNRVIFKINKASNDEVNIKFRVPDWCVEAEGIVVSLNGKRVATKTVNSYIEIKRKWNAGDIVELVIPLEVQVSRLPDNKNVVAFSYGPLVLSAGMGKEDMSTVAHGIQVLRSSKTIPIKDYILLKNTDPESWLSDIKNNLVKTKGKVEFKLKNTDEDNNLIFKPHYKRYQERYGIYFTLVEEDSKDFKKIILEKKEREKKAKATIDKVQITNDQHELQHNLQGNSAGGNFGGYNFRHANFARKAENGAAWFSYEMAVDPSVDNYLSVKYFSGDAGRKLNIFVDDHLLKEETLKDKKPGDFYDESYKIPKECLVDKEKVSIKFANRGRSLVGGIYDSVYILKEQP